MKPRQALHIRHRILLRCLLPVLLLGTSRAPAQQFFVTQYTLKDGLPHPSVFRIFADRQRLLWFGTDYGVARFDGKTFQTAFDDTTGLLASAVFGVSERASGAKLISASRDCLLELTDTGVGRLAVPGLDTLLSLYAFEQGRSIFFIGKSAQFGERLYEIRDGRLMLRLLTDSARHNIVCSKAVQASGSILLTTSAGLYQIVGGRIRPLLPHAVREEVRDVARAPDGGYWVGLKKKLLFISPRGIRQEFPLPTGKEVNDILLDHQGAVWISVRTQGLLLLKDGRLTDLTGDMDFGSAVINDMLEDFEGNVWVATYGAGVFRISPREAVHYPFSQPGKTIFCRALCAIGPDKILIGGLGEMFVKEGNAVRPYRLRFLRPDYFIYFITVHDGRLLIGTSGGLIVQNLARPAEEKIIRYGALSVCKATDGTVRTGGYNYIYEWRKDSLLRVTTTAGPAHRYFALEEDRDGHLICGTHNHLLRLQRGATAFDTLLSNTGIVNDILRDAFGRLWVASNNGLYCLDGARIKHYRAPDALSANKCVSLTEDGRGLLWVGAMNGLSYVNLQTLEIAQLTDWPVDVVMSLESDRPGHLYVGTAGKLIALQTDRLPLFRRSAPPLFVTTISANGVKQPVAGDVHLPYRANKLSIGYVGLSYSSPQAVEYRYKLAPTDDGWHYTKADRLEFSSLQSGQYRFVLNARAAGGPWSKDVVLSITVATPVWKRWWFVAAVAVCGAALLFFLMRHGIVRREKRKRERLSMHNRIAYLKQQALHALINPHFIFNCLNSIQHFLNEHDNEKAADYLADFAYLIRTTLEDAQKAFITLDREIERIALYLSFEQLRFGEALRSRIVVQDGIEPRAVSMPNMILQPFIENAIWHGILPKQSEGAIQIHFARKGDALEISIEDDGVGLRTAQATEGKTSLGISLTAQRLLMLEKLTGQEYRYRIGAREDGRPGVRLEIRVPAKPATGKLLPEEERQYAAMS